LISRHLLVTVIFLFALTLALAVYVWQLRQREVAAPRPKVAAAVGHVEPPGGPAVQVTIYVAYDNPGVLRPETVTAPLGSSPQERAESLMRELVARYSAKNSPHALGSGAEVRKVYFVAPGLAVIDVNSAFVDGQVSGILAEDLTIASMIETLAANIPGLARVKILVDGKERDTLAGHADLSGFYDVPQVEELAKELEGQ
jgi:hypothetical protein